MRPPVVVRHVNARDSAGRLDLLLLRIAERASAVYLQPFVNRLQSASPLVKAAVPTPVNVWEDLLRPFAEQKVRDLGIPSKPITPAAILRRKSAGRARLCRT